MIFLTVGLRYPFDRLVRAVDGMVAAGAVGEDVFAQVGRGGYRPRYMRWVEALERGAFADCIGRARALIGHAGMGTIRAAMEAEKPLLVVPRVPRFHEIVNDHQVLAAHKFSTLGHVLMARDETEIAGKIKELGSFLATPRRARPEGIIERVRQFFEEVAAGCPPG